MDILYHISQKYIVFIALAYNDIVLRQNTTRYSGSSFLVVSNLRGCFIVITSIIT